MKIIIVGDFLAQIYEQAIFNAFLKLGHNVFKFSVGNYLGDQNLYVRIQNKFLCGPIIRKINNDLISYVEMEKPDLVFIYRGNVVFAKTIKTIKKSGAIVFGYNNDDPFSKKHSFYLWRHFLKASLYYDHIFVYRHKNIEDYKKIDYGKTSLLRSYYIAERNFPIENLPSDQYKCDVIFVGHYENDGRDEYVKAIIDAGINFKLYGPEWRRSKYYGFFKEKLGEIYSITDDYNFALNSAKICLVFLSKLNNDTYTRRCFEITAAEKFMLSEYTDDLNSMFRQGKEAEYFKNKEEILKKIKYYLAHDEKREKIAEASHQRLMKDGHEVKDRIKEILRIFSEFKK